MESHIGAHARCATPRCTRTLQQLVSAEHIGSNEFIRPADRSVEIRLGGELHHAVDILIAHEIANQLCLTDVASHESIPSQTLSGGQIRSIAGVRELV